MLIRNRKLLHEAMKKHPQLRGPVETWLALAEAAQWHSIIDARDIFPTADAIKGTPFTCFNLGGNKFRLIARISYQLQEIIIREVLTHAEYSRKY